MTSGSISANEVNQPICLGYLSVPCAAAFSVAVPSVDFLGDPSARLRTLLPDEPGFDLAMNTFVFDPGATLPMVESHVMEHGLIFLEGGGVYRLGDAWCPVTAGDSIWMAPYLPQWFGALGKTPSRYHYYKDVNRDPLHEARR